MMDTSSMGTEGLLLRPLLLHPQVQSCVDVLLMELLVQDRQFAARLCAVGPQKMLACFNA